MAVDEEELERFVRDQHPRLVGALGLYTGDRHVAEELAAEALVRVVERWERVRRSGSPGGYAHRIAINLANSRMRRRGALRRALARRGPVAASHLDPDTPVAVAVRDAVAALPNRQRACVVLHYFVGLTTGEVAVALDVSGGTVRSNLHAARTSLRGVLGDEVSTGEVDAWAIAEEGSP